MVNFLLVHLVLGAVNELLHALGAIVEPIVFNLFGVPGCVVVVAMVELGSPVVGPAGVNLLLTPDFVSILIGFGLPFASDDAVRLVEVSILCVSIANLVPSVTT